jgi:hypothetical protein
MIGAFLLVYAIGLGVGIAAGQLEGTASSIAFMGVRLTVAIAGAFASGYVALVLAGVVADHQPPKGSIAATLRVHAKELVAAGLLGTLIGLPLDRILPGMSLALLGPPIVAQVVVLEYRRFPEAIRRTRELLAGQVGRALLHVLGFALIVIIVYYTTLIIGLPFIAPYFSATMLLLYLDLRARGEELDYKTFVAERENAMDAPSAADPNQD